MISQAEHDPNAASVLITDSDEVANKVREILPSMVSDTKHSQRVEIALKGQQSGIVLVKDKETALELANAYGAEHLEIHTENAQADALKITNAGAIFVGPYNPVPLGDYMAGSNHVLPTAGTARFTSGLNVHSFIKSVQEIRYSRSALEEVYEPLSILAYDENLPAHAQSLKVRLDK